VDGPVDITVYNSLVFFGFVSEQSEALY
jgi:hypothetical protein